MGCTHDCGSCSSSCGEPESLLKKPHEKSTIRKVIGVVSGKGGVGKSLVTSMLAIEMQRRGKHCGILDADVTGPSIPQAFGLTGKLMASEDGVYPMKTRMGIDVCSINLLLDDVTDPVVWRGPVIGGSIQQFWQEVIWEDIDFMFVDMPPGTGDVALTEFQSLPVDGIIIMTSPDCGKKISVFGESHVDEVAKANDLEVLAKLPFDPSLAAACDAGNLETILLPDLTPVCEKLESL